MAWRMTSRVRIFTIFLMCCLSVQIAVGQESKREAREAKKAQKDSIRDVKVAQGKGLISPLVVPGYTPELAVQLRRGIPLTAATQNEFETGCRDRSRDFGHLCQLQ